MGSHKNDIDLNTTGSLNLENELKDIEEDNLNSPEEKQQNIADPLALNQDQIDQLMKDIFNTGFVEKELEQIAATPTYVLNAKDDHIWLYSLTKNTFFKVGTKSHIISIDKVTDDISHCLINNDLYEVQNNMIKCIGWN